MRWSRIAVAAIGPALVAAHHCEELTNDLETPRMAPGYVSHISAQGLKFPRHIQFDSHNNLLVVDRGVGIYRFKVDECLLLQDKTLIIDDQYVSAPKNLTTVALTRRIPENIHTDRCLSEIIA